MKLSNKTINILKNFATINQSIVIKPGNSLQTISNVKDTFAKATIEETFDKSVSIYDLNEFLGVIGLFEDPELEFGDKYVELSEGKTKQTYFYADPSVITQPPEKGVTIPSVEVTAKLTKEQLGKLIRSASVNKATDLTFTKGNVKVHEKTVPTSNNFEMTDVASAGNYELTIKVDKLKMISDDYNINICAKGLAHFEGSQGVEYFVALQPNGFYGE